MRNLCFVLDFFREFLAPKSNQIRELIDRILIFGTMFLFMGNLLRGGILVCDFGCVANFIGGVEIVFVYSPMFV